MNNYQPRTAKPRILITDDEQDIIEILSYNLEKENYEVFAGYSSTECLRLAKEVRPDLIILDIWMPGTDGIETCKILKRDPGFKNIPIILFTAFQKSILPEIAKESGADLFLSKPVRMNRITAIIHDLLSNTSRHDYQN